MSVLRQIMLEDGFEDDPAESLRSAALLVRRAGLEHLVTEATKVEIVALADAGEILEHERAVLWATVAEDPTRAAVPIDGGASLRKDVLHTALALAARGG